MRIGVWHESPFCVADKIFPCYAGGGKICTSSLGEPARGLDSAGGSEASAMIEA